jgi:ubiquinone/menaquinone biosynthesis C-methylase UbiE
MMTIEPGSLDAYLPDYPHSLFELLSRELSLPERPMVVDVGAGSGRASLAMARLGWHVTAVDPDGAALDVLRARAADERLDVATVQATAEETGLDATSVDLVTAAHSFHWFKKRAALAEMARITRPGGGVALFWNVRDRDRSPFVAGYQDLLDRHGVAKRLYLEAERASGRATREALAAAAGLSSPRLHHVQHDMSMRPDDFIKISFAPAFVRAFSSERQDAFRTEVIELLAHHGFGGEASFTIPYRIDCWIATRSTS